jgi:hypothetical protein
MPASRKLLTPAKARNAALINQCATPGLGSLIAGRILAGIGQLAVALTGFGFFIAWFVATIRQFYSLIDGNIEVKPIGWLGLTGVGIFGAAWLWSLVTSLSLIREARRNAPALFAQPPSPPPLPPV